MILVPCRVLPRPSRLFVTQCPVNNRTPYVFLITRKGWTWGPTDRVRMGRKFQGATFGFVRYTTETGDLTREDVPSPP